MRMRWAGCVANLGDIRNSYNILVEKPEQKSPLRRPRCRWEDNARMDLRGTGWEGLDWMHLAQDRDKWQALVDMVKYLQVP
jgi:hypothetical protein